MNANKPLNDLLMLAAAFLLLLPLGAAAQRRPIAPPGLKQPAPRAAAPKAEEKDRDSKPGEPQPAAAEPAAAKPAAKAQPAVRDDQAEPAAAEPETTAPALKEPEILLPKDELDAPRSAQPRDAAAAPAREVVYRRRLDKHSVTLRVRPAQPQPARSAALVFEVVQLLETPDPAFGSRKPLEHGAFVATFSLDGQVKGSRRLHPLENPGAYGLHFTAPQPGVYRIELAQQLENPEIGDLPLTAEFLLGFGKETPMEPASGDEQEDSLQVRRSSRTLRVVSAKDKDAPADLMVELGERWMALHAALEGPQADPDELAAHAEAIKQLGARLPGRAPAEARAEFEQLAAHLESLSGLPAAFSQPASALQLMERTGLDGCSRCHARFRFRLTDDVGKWPQFSPKTGN